MVTISSSTSNCSKMFDSEILFFAPVMLKLRLPLDAQVANEVWSEAKTSYLLNKFLIDDGSSLYSKWSLVQ